MHARLPSDAYVAARAASGAGSHRNQSSSISAFVSTLVPCIVLAVVLVGLFLLLRMKQQRLYAPRTFHDALSQQEKTPVPGQSFLGWVNDFQHISDEYILSHHSLDGYLYVRFLKMLVFMSLVGCFLTWTVLFPVNATGGGGESGLDILSFSNVDDATRYFAHALIAWVFFGFVLYVIWRELLFLVKIRQAYLLSAWNASRISQRTVLFTDVPEGFLSHARLHSLFQSVSQIWLVSDTSNLDDDVDDVDDTALKLEGAEVKLIKTAVKLHTKEYDEKPSGGASQEMTWDQVLSDKDKPTHRLKPLIGEKVDTIDYCINHLKEVLPKVHSARRSHLSGKEKLVSAVFIEFETQAAAQAAYALTIHHKPASFVARQFSVLPDEIIWKNLKMKSWDRSARRGIATAAISALILFWSVPVAPVGIISNVNYLTENVPFLAWIDDIPPTILGVVTGLLPTVLLAALMALVPIICRYVAKLAGAATLSEVEQQTQVWYFAFQVIQVFLITTFTSGATAVASQIVSDPTQAVPLLAKNLPKASNFYISYFVLYGVANSAKYLFNLMGLVGVFVLGRFAKTPRKQYEKWMALKSPKWGSEYPKWTNLGVIALSYAVIAPLVLGFATVGMGLIYLAYRYNMLYVHKTQIDTKGACYARALQQLMVGVYLAELCLLGLFGIGVGSRFTAIGPVVLQVILIAATVVFHVALRKNLHPLVHTLPLNLLVESEHPHGGVVSSAERGALVDGEEMHPGLPLKNDALPGNQNAPEGSLVSGSTANYSAGYRTQTLSNDATQHEQPSPHKRTLLQRLFAPHTQSFASLRSSLDARFRSPVRAYTVDEARDAFLNPTLVAKSPVIWLAKDQLGISREEMSRLQEALGQYDVEVTDEGAVVDEKGKVQWIDESATTAPLWKGRVTY